MDFRTDAIYCGDCQNVLPGHIPDESIDLIYVDPPFFTNRTYETPWKDGYELRAFEDRWKGGIENYISWMEPKMRQCNRVLKKTGSMYLHCDWHANAHLRILMDEVFGKDNLQNELIWYYHTGGASRKRFQRSHDNLLFYTKGDEWTFNWRDLMFRRTEKSLERAANPKGARISADDVYKIPEDVLEIQQMNPMARERLGYPTQKPEALLEQLVKVSSNPGDIVLDPMCGCGTAIATAYKLKRKYIGIDVSPTACKVMLDRMHEIGAYGSTDKKLIVGYPMRKKEIMALTPFEFQNFVCEKMLAQGSQKKTGDLGIDGYCLDGRLLQVKQSKGIGREVLDKFETALKRKGKSRGVIVAYSFGRGAHEEVARAKKDGLEIDLTTLDDILKNDLPEEEE